MSLLEACLSTGHMPTPEEAVSDAQKDGRPSWTALELLIACHGALNLHTLLRLQIHSIKE